MKTQPNKTVNVPQNLKFNWKLNLALSLLQSLIVVAAFILSAFFVDTIKVYYPVVGEFRDYSISISIMIIIFALSLLEDY